MLPYQIDFWVALILLCWLACWAGALVLRAVAIVGGWFGVLLISTMVTLFFFGWGGMACKAYLLYVPLLLIYVAVTRSRSS